MNKKQTYWAILLFCIIALCLHLIADSNSGFSNDEFLHIETGNHPALGYMEFPPILGWLAYIQNSFHSTSVYVHHIFVHIASLLILIIVALSVAELGGKTKAVFFALLCMLVSPGLEMSEQLFQPVVFSQLFWVLGFYQLIRWIKTSDRKYFLYLMLSLALGFLTKYDIVFFIAGLGSLLFFAKTRSALLTRSNAKYILLFILLIAPNVFWQYQHGYPLLHMFSRLYDTQLDKLSPLKVIAEIVIALNPFVFIVILFGSVSVFSSGAKEIYRPAGITIILSVLFLAIAKSKAYYFFPALICLLVFGSIWLELLLSRRTWLAYPISILFVLSGILMLPWGLTVLPLDTFIKISLVSD